MAEYHRYLRDIDRKAMIDGEGVRLILEHDVTHVIFGMDTSLEQEAGLDTWLLFGCQFKWRYLRGYSQLPEIKALYQALIAEGGWRLFGAPTVFPVKSNRLSLCQERVFGPVVSIQIFDEGEEVLSLANDSRFGLVGYCWTNSSA